ncbi:hypothetical protein [Cellulomonas rhizosphaerae]|uniref:Uncharacterized protein n=1 Tax=Cellulomonas rhizosphaerae TaxID=2293719 RepID=A0A413RH52_9CELL|nr:hypothetical protein [Cellulomonas rhizosphaerae]RHA37108.1 hypothetical protein D1825_17620 [Cellulomonas rhizosphaerae]
MSESWFPLAAADPVPGDPRAVRRASERYEDVALAIATAAARLREIAAQRHDASEAVAGIATKAGDVADQIGRARGRYAAVGRALGAYAVRLDAAQGAAHAALRAGRGADDERQDAEARVVAARAALESATPDDLPARTRELERARADQDVADRALDAARADLERAVQARDAAAETAAVAIRDSLHDGLDDGWWQDWGKAVLTTIAAVADVVANVCGWLALLFCWVPGLGEVLVLAALLAAAVKLAADIVLAASDDDVTWGDVGWDAVGLIPGGLGKGAGAMARTTTKVAAGTARHEAGVIAAKAPHLRPAGVPRVGSSQDVMRALLGDAPVMSRTAAREAMTAASGRKAFRDMFDPRIEFRAVREGTERFRTKPLREWWADSRGATFAVRMLGDPELAKDLDSVKRISPVLVAASPDTAAAVSSSLRWRRAAAGAYGLTAADALLGPQDVADAATTDEKFATGTQHAFGGLHSDPAGDARRELRLGARG